MHRTPLTSSQKPETDLWSASVLILCQLCSKRVCVYVCVQNVCYTQMNHSRASSLLSVSRARPAGLWSADLFPLPQKSWMECQEGKVMPGRMCVSLFIHACCTCMYACIYWIVEAECPHPAVELVLCCVALQDFEMYYMSVFPLC